MNQNAQPAEDVTQRADENNETNSGEDRQKLTLIIAESGDGGTSPKEIQKDNRQTTDDEGTKLRPLEEPQII